MNKEEFILEIKKLGVDVTSEKLEKLDLFYEMLLEWNKKINLTAITDEKEIYLKHFFDSLTLCKVIDLDNELTLCDVGSGAGFPGIILKIFFPKLKITLIDSLNKRVNYLNTVISNLKLSNIVAIHVRMEDFSRLNEEKFDIITARAVSSLSVLSEISVRSLKINGSLIFMKANCDLELESIDNVMKSLYLGNLRVVKFVLPNENSNRTLVSMTKLKTTNNKFPRPIDKIKKNPL